MSAESNKNKILKFVEKAHEETYFSSAVGALKEKFPSHAVLTDVGPKVVTLNGLAGTNLQMVPGQIEAMSKRIVALANNENFEKATGDERSIAMNSLVLKIAAAGECTNTIEMRNNFSFATKYCHFFVSNEFVIYDRNVIETLRILNRDKNFKFSDAALGDNLIKKNNTSGYTNYVEAFEAFVDAYDLTKIKFKNLKRNRIVELALYQMYKGFHSDKYIKLYLKKQKIERQNKKLKKEKASSHQQDNLKKNSSALKKLELEIKGLESDKQHKNICYKDHVKRQLTRIKP